MSSILFLLVFAAAAAAQTPDTTPPTITATATTEPNANGWYRSNVRVKFTCADLGGSRLASCPAAVVVSTEGEGQVITGTARDRAGNTASDSVTLNIDKTPPVVTASPAPEAPASGWHTTPVTVSFSATDALSGVEAESVTAPITLATDRTNGSATGRATDLAGNKGSFKLTGINIDQRAPRITVTLASTIGTRGYRTSAVTAHFTCTDARSGIADCPADQVIDSDGAHTVTGSTTDHAGHTASVSKAFNLDATLPVIEITGPQSPVTVDHATITGRAFDTGSGLLSLVRDGRKIRVGADGSFSSGPVTLAEGPTTLTFIGTDRAGNVREHVLTLTHTPPPPPCTNLVVDPQFDIGESSFTAQDASSIVARTEINPLEGASSLRVLITGYGNNIWWVRNFSGGRASNLAVSAHLRVDATTSSELQFCAMAYYQDGTTGLSCTTVSGTQGDHGTVTATLPLDSAKPLETVRIRMYQEGAEPFAFTLDAAFVCLDIVEEPPVGDDDPGDGDPDDPPSGVCPVPNPSSIYTPYNYALPTARPYLSLAHYLNADPNSSAYIQFQAGVDDALAGGPPYAYSATHSVIMYRLIGDERYLEDAIERVDQFVLHGEAAIAAGNQPALAGDSYLEVGWFIEQLALAYDFGFDLLTPSQRQRWTRFGDQAIHNVWHPADATWDSQPHPWTGWSICDPGNNYHYSFLRATMLWAWARQDLTLLDFLQTQKFPPLMDYFAALPGGGSREGTGYGTAQKNLFENYVFWKSATGQDLANITPHTKETIDYWVHATVPTLDRFAPIGDQSRSSIPELYDYHENLVHSAVVLSPATPQASRGAWWLQHNSVNGPIHQFNAAPYLMSYNDPPVAPTDLTYHAIGVGAFFARSSWATDASWISVVAGKYDQSHAHHDQGSFTFFKNDWLAVTNNIWSHSGITLDDEVHNVVRFVRADGTTIRQNPSETVQSSMVPSSAGGVIHVAANLTNAYSLNASLVQNWTREIQLSGDVLTVSDQCTVAAGVRPIFQLQVPAEPALQPDGSIVAGNLRIVPLHPVSVSWTAMAAPEFNGGYRIELTTATGCSFQVELHAQ